MPKGLTAKGAATRTRVLAGAAELISHRGVADTTLDDIRIATGTSKSQLFHYFPGGKDQLLTEVARFQAERVLDTVRARMNPLTSWAAWRQWRDQLLGEYDSLGAPCPLSVLINQLAPATPGARLVVASMVTQWRAHVRAGIEQMRATGAIRPELDPERGAAAVLATVHGGAALMALTGSVDDLAAALDAAIDYLRCPPGPVPERVSSMQSCM